MGSESYVPQKLVDYVEEREIVSIEDVMRDLGVSKVTSKNYLSRLAKMGIIKRVGRGLYQLGTGNSATVEVSSEMSQLAQYLQERFPMASFIIWSLDMLAEYAHYAIGRNLIFLETDKMLSASMRDALIERGYHVVLDPRKRDFREYAYYDEKPLFVVTRKEKYGVMRIGDLQTPTVERIWLDLYYLVTRKELSFSPSELGIIFANMLQEDGVNFHRLLRYANRRNLRDEVIIYLYGLSQSSKLPIPASVLVGRKEALRVIEEMVKAARE